MQAVSINISNRPYDGLMQIGRPSKKPRTIFGERIFNARTSLGLSQSDVSQTLGISQTAYSDWERYPVALKPEQIEKLTVTLKITVEELFQKNGTGKKSGPTGKARKLFEKVSRLPRSQQNHILTVVEAFVEKKTER